MKGNDIHQFNYQEVKVDIPTMRSTCMTAVRYAKAKLLREIREMESELEQSYFAERDGDNEKAYREVCNANTGTEFMLDAAKDLQQAIHSYFAMCEAMRRDNVTFMRPELDE